MKHINKNTPPAEFIDFINKEHPNKWSDIHKSLRFPNLYVNCRYEILISEQGGLGGYTERPLMGASDLHIDHFKKKGMNWPYDVMFDWNNFIVEERTNQYGACYKDNNTSNIQDYNKLLNPVMDYPEQLMTYLPNGEIIAKRNIDDLDKEKVEFTIERFNLNHPLLKSERETLIKLIRDGYSSLSDEEIVAALEDNGYPTVVEWILSIRDL